MAEYIIKEETLVSIADEIRDLSGTTDELTTGGMIDTLHTENTNFDSNITEQTDLISQIASIVATKANPQGGGGGSSGIETVSITFSDYPDPGSMIYYIGADLILHTEELNHGNTYVILKNSIFATIDSTFYFQTDKVTQLFSRYSITLYQVTG